MARTVGVQSYTYRHFPVLKMLDEVRAAGLEAIELWPGHLRPEAPDAEAERLLEEVAARGLRICGYGVVRLGPNTPGQLRLARRVAAELADLDPALRQAVDADCDRLQAWLAHQGVDLDAAAQPAGTPPAQPAGPGSAPISPQ